MTHIFVGAGAKLTNITLYSSISKPMIIIRIYSSVPTNIKKLTDECCFHVVLPAPAVEGCWRSAGTFALAVR
jgi:hypothetical protein